ncbi:MAG TPA: NUDIX domain-containing protein [Pyrinomonadaceae bacterium]|nr:NUDIX domain-containing protein [Pyrinomonadaceae bacterium]
MGSDLIGIIPAAGRGTRMGERGEQLPKALLTVEGVTLLDRAIDTLKSLNVSRIIVVVSHLGKQIAEHIEARDFGIDIKLVHQSVPLGLAHAIATAAPEVTGDFVVFCPDNLYTHQSDLVRAYELFEAQGPTFLLVASAQPTKQSNRRTFHIDAHATDTSDVFDYARSQMANSGLPVNSTGCVFFSRDALKYLPDFDADREHIFRDFLETITAKQKGLISLMRGMRYDFSSPEDINEYETLMSEMKGTAGKGVSAILINPSGKVLLQQRDNNPSIRYPNHWALFGGSMEDGETADEAVVREVEEEIGFQLQTFGLFREFIQNNKREFAFVGSITANLSELTLSEGQGMDFFFPSELKELLIRPDDKETLEAYFGN